MDAELERRLTTLEVTLRDGLDGIARRLDLTNGRMAALERWRQEHDVQHAHAAGRRSAEEDSVGSWRWRLGLLVTAAAATANLVVQLAHLLLRLWHG